jgi:hypothetical protein
MPGVARSGVTLRKNRRSLIIPRFLPVLCGATNKAQPAPALAPCAGAIRAMPSGEGPPFGMMARMNFE